MRLAAAASVAVPLLMYARPASDAALCFTAVLFLLRTWALRDREALRLPWVPAAAAFFIYVAVRGAVSGTPAASVGAAVAWLRFPLFIAALTLLFRRVPGTAVRTFRVYAGVAAFGVLDTLWQKFHGADVFGRVPNDPLRLTGPLLKPAIGIMLTFIALPAVVYALTRLRGRHRFVAAAGIALWMAAVTLSGERMALYLALFALFVSGIVLLRPRLRVIAAAAAAVVGVWMLLFTFEPNFHTRQQRMFAEFADPTHSVYVQVFSGGGQVFAEHPLWGVGLHAYRYACPEAQSADGATLCEHLHPHQLWIESLAENGLIGTGLLLYMLVQMLRLPLRRCAQLALRPLSEVEALRCGGVAAALLRLWPIAVTGSFFSSHNALIFWPMLAAALAAE